jgi:ABC-type amino acid transport substrate-binding protein
MKKYLALVLAGMMAFSLAGCSEAASEAQQAASSAGIGQSDVKAAADAASSALSDAGIGQSELTEAANQVASAAQSLAGSVDAGSIDVLKDGTLTVGTNAAFPPFEYIGDDGKPDGFDIALINAIGDRLGVKVEVSDMEFDSLVSSIGSKIDVAIAGMTITDERKQSVDFSEPYYDATQFVLVPAGSAIKTADDLKGKKIGTQLGTTGDSIASEIEGATDSAYDKAVDAVNDMNNGKVDCVIIDKNPAEVFAAQFPDKVTALDGSGFGFDVEQYGIAMPKGDTALCTAINAALESLKADGTFAKLEEQYITNYSAQ